MQSDEMFKRARRALLLDHCFFGSLVMHLEPIEDAEAKRGLWVDGVNVGFDPATFDVLPLEQAAGLVAKGVLHCALEHHVRRMTRDKQLWQDACDFVTNPLLIGSGLELPPGYKIDPQYADMSAEQVYRLLELEREKQKQQQKQQGDGKGQKGSGSTQGNSPSASPPGQEKPGQQQKTPGSGSSSGEVRDLPGQNGQAPAPAEVSKQKQEWKINMQQALQNALSRGDLPGNMKRMIEKQLAPTIDWRTELRRFMQAVAKDDSTWSRPNRRFIGSGLYLPTIHSPRMPLMVVVNDTSGSTMSAQEFFLAEMQAICEDVNPERIMYVQQDAQIQRVDDLEPGDSFDRNMHGGGGTDFRPVFRMLDDAGIVPACMVFLTDLEGPFPEEPEYPVLWAACGTTQSAPFGDVVEIDISKEGGVS